MELKLDGFLYFTRTEAASAHSQSLGHTVNDSPYRLNVGGPSFFGTDMGVTDFHTYAFTFAAYITFKGHLIHLLIPGVSQILL